MDACRAKVLVMGPRRCGKTRVANFLAAHDESPNFQVYQPTKGCRVVECEQSVQVGKRSVNTSVELWDCSGDRQYEACWPAVRPLGSNPQRPLSAVAARLLRCRASGALRLQLATALLLPLHVRCSDAPLLCC
jgi:hypothetical protein